jgi:hypothetical protein
MKGFLNKVPIQEQKKNKNGNDKLRYIESQKKNFTNKFVIM